MAECLSEKSTIEVEKCSICLEPFVDPRLLPCCHTFCTVCLDGLPKDCDRNVTCPLCKEISIVPLEGITGFASDYKIIQDSECVKLKASINLGKLEELEKCTCCKEVDDLKLISSCSECGGFLCENCVYQHKKLRVFSTHEVIDIDESIVTPRRVRICSIHSHEFNAYCKKCNKLICHECVIKNHKVCTGESYVYTIEEMDSSFKNKLIKLNRHAEEKLVESVHRQRQIAKVEEDIVGASHTKELQDQINCTFDSLLSELTQYRDDLLAKVEENNTSLKKGIWAQKNFIEMFIKKLESGLSCIKKASHCSNPAERILMSVQASNLLEDVLSSDVDNAPLPHPLIYCTANYSGLGSKYGGILKELTSSNLTVAVADTANLEEAVVINIEYSECSLKSTPVNVRLLYGYSKKVIDSDAIVYYDDEDKRWSVEFVPRCAGKHTLLVLIGGIVVHSFEFVVGGHLRCGSCVQRGPDWAFKSGDGTDNLLSGTVTDVKEDSVTVRWEISDLREPRDDSKQERMSSDEGMESKPMLATKSASVISSEPFTDHHDDEISQSQEIMELNTAVYEYKDHIWGRNGVYEVELLLS